MTHQSSRNVRVTEHAVTDPRVRAAEAVEKERDLPEEIMTNCLFVQPSLTQAGRPGEGVMDTLYAVFLSPLAMQMQKPVQPQRFPPPPLWLNILCRLTKRVRRKDKRSGRKNPFGKNTLGHCNCGQTQKVNCHLQPPCLPRASFRKPSRHL